MLYSIQDTLFCGIDDLVIGTVGLTNISDNDNVTISSSASWSGTQFNFWFDLINNNLQTSKHNL